MGASIQKDIKKRANGFLGGIASSNPTRTKNCVADEQIALGKFCTDGTDGLVNLAGASSSIDGVVMKSSTTQGATVEANQSTSLLKGGDIFAYTETACVSGAKVYVRHTANGNLAVGNVRADADTDKAVEVTATFNETMTGAGIVSINVNL